MPSTMFSTGRICATGSMFWVIPRMAIVRSLGIVSSLRPSLSNRSGPPGYMLMYEPPNMLRWMTTSIRAGSVYFSSIRRVMVTPDARLSGSVKSTPVTRPITMPWKLTSSPGSMPPEESKSTCRS